MSDRTWRFIGVRWPLALADRLEDHRKALEAESPPGAPRTSMSAALRNLAIRALESDPTTSEAASPSPPRKPPRPR